MQLFFLVVAQLACMLVMSIIYSAQELLRDIHHMHAHELSYPS